MTPTPSPLRQPRNQLIVASAMLLFVVTAVVQGIWTDRWNGKQDLQKALAKLDHAPLSAGTWTGRLAELDAEMLDRARRVGIDGSIRREFRRTPDGQNVSTILMCGRFGPLSVHTPDICYAGAGYVILGLPTRVDIPRSDDREATFWTARFHKPKSPEAVPLRLFWGWNSGDGWKAPDNPRWTFRMKPVLYKLYVAREMGSLDDPLKSDPGLAFLQSWLPELDRTLYEK
jgi:hypothetical protein